MMEKTRQQIMGILNVTPDSFYPKSRKQTEKEIASRTEEVFEQGGDIIDIGACSTRPGAVDVPQEEELNRLKLAFTVVRSVKKDAEISVDTFRADIARIAVKDLGATMINDVSGGEDAQMFATASTLNVPYVLTSHKSRIKDIKTDFAKKLSLLHQLGLKKIILDPGFGFGKTLKENFDILRDLKKIKQAFKFPIIAGLSRKSMIYETLACTPAEALNGTTALNAIALCNGASILRVHDVKEAVETVKLYQNL